MELGKAQSMAIKLMDKHGLLDTGWRFEFDNAQKRLGVCKFGKKLVSMSRYFVSSASEDEVEQIMLHEIAHALLPYGVHHGSEWKIKAASIGYNGKRTAHNPYAAEQEKALIGSLPMEPSSVPEMGLIAKVAGVPAVGIGSVIAHKGIEYTIFKRAKTRWHAVDKVTGKRASVPFNVAHLYLAK